MMRANAGDPRGPETNFGNAMKHAFGLLCAVLVLATAIAAAAAYLTPASGMLI